MVDSIRKSHTEKLSRMSAALVPREMLSWSLSAVGLGALEGGLLGVIVKNQFAQVASPMAVNFAVAVVVGAPAFANLASFLVSNLAHGRNKPLMLSRLMLMIGLCLLIMILPGRSVTGLVIFSVMAILARSAWSGVLTIRAAVWRANYQRQWRARVTARIVRLAALLVAGMAALVGWSLDWSEDAYRIIFLFAAVSMIAASLTYRRTRVRRHGHLLRAENATRVESGKRAGFGALLGVLRKDRDFRKYMLGMMIFGSGNLMVIAMLVVLLNEHFIVSRFEQVVITSSLPLLMLSLCIPIWAKLLDSRHIFEFRAIQSWFFAATIAMFAVAVIWHLTAALWLGSLLLGAAYAGGHLGWNLGHNDFTDDAGSTHYMAIHVMLTGFRGLVMPILGVAFYQYLDSLNPDYGPYSMLLPFSLSFAGSLYFVHLYRLRKGA